MESLWRETAAFDTVSAGTEESKRMLTTSPFPSHDLVNPGRIISDRSVHP